MGKFLRGYFILFYFVMLCYNLLYLWYHIHNYVNIACAVLCSEASWCLIDPDPSAWFNGYRLVLSLEKAYGHTDIWANVIKSE